MPKEFTIAVCGSARVGKSTLVNALCGKQRNDILANDNASSMEYSITIYDTPGIESWTEQHVQSYFSKIMEQSKPLCMIYCASPGSFARLDQLQWLIDNCIKSNIFCAFVCTNKYSGGTERRAQVLKDFHSLLTGYHGMTRDEGNIKYYGNVALCTAVNSIVYEDREFGVRKEVEGINELIFGILTSLKDDKIVGWCYTVADNQSFWVTMQSQLIKFFEISQQAVTKFFNERGKDIVESVIPLILSVLKR
ncbi:unnamed protein product [Rotaria sordida]|uniref:G domain-containing protein n=1 Tax=Rotaria sordida TaxID=392033 RepID=A0A815PKS8_9BILA|nr:unnamed protein product [Rotaria sordida]CAF1450363.1 unnamed protein product [Rotaria sordida]